MFHELFHVVNGALALPKDKKERYYLSELLEIPFDIASRNPESYKMVAVAYDYILNSTPDEDGFYIEFDTGFATIGEESEEEESEGGE